MPDLFDSLPRFIDAPELRPCPFCGQGALLRQFTAENYSVGCPSAFTVEEIERCRFRPVWSGGKHKTEAIAAWNAQVRHVPLGETGRTTV